MSEDNSMTLEDALAALSKVRAADAKKRTQIDALEAERDTLKGQVTAYEAHGTPEQVSGQLKTLETVTAGLGKLGVKLDDPSALSGWLDALPARLERAGQADALEATVGRTKAAASLSVSEEALAEWLGDRKPLLRKVKAEDGSEREVYGLGEGESFKPLTSFQTLAALAGKAAPAAPAPAAYTGVGAGREAAQLLTPQEKVAQTKLNSGEYNL